MRRESQRETPASREEGEQQRSVSLLRATLESTADGLLVVDTAGRPDLRAVLAAAADRGPHRRARVELPRRHRAAAGRGGAALPCRCELHPGRVARLSRHAHQPGAPRGAGDGRLVRRGRGREWRDPTDRGGASRSVEGGAGPGPPAPVPARLAGAAAGGRGGTDRPTGADSRGDRGNPGKVCAVRRVPGPGARDGNPVRAGAAAHRARRDAGVDQPVQRVAQLRHGRSRVGSGARQSSRSVARQRTALRAGAAGEQGQERLPGRHVSRAAHAAQRDHRLRHLLATRVAGPLTEQQDQYLDRIQIQADDLLRIITEVLSYSRTEAGREKVSVEKFDVAELVREVAGKFGRVAEQKGLEFRVRAPEARVTIRSDRAKVSSILENLLANAIKFTDRGEVELLGGHVSVESEPGRGSTFTVPLPSHHEPERS